MRAVFEPPEVCRGSNVGVLDVCARNRFALEALDGLAQVANLRMKELDCEPLTQVRVLRAINGSHPAFADELLDPVSARDDVTNEPTRIGSGRSAGSCVRGRHRISTVPRPAMR